MSAVLMPCPSSHFPVKTAIAPLSSMRIHESSFGSRSRLPGSFLSSASCAMASPGGSEKLKINAPPPSRQPRRDGVTLLSTLTACLMLWRRVVFQRLTRSPDGTEDPHMSATAAEIRSHVGADLSV